MLTNTLNIASGADTTLYDVSALGTGCTSYMVTVPLSSSYTAAPCKQFTVRSQHQSRLD